MHPSGAAQKTASITPRPASYAAPSPSPTSPPRQDASGARHRPAVLGKRSRRCRASPPRRFSREYRLGGAPAVKGGCHAWDYPHFPVERRSCRQGEMRPWSGGGIGLNLSALERNRTADCSAGYPARPERRTALFRPQKKKTGTALDEPSPLPSVQPQGVPAPPSLGRRGTF